MERHENLLDELSKAQRKLELLTGKAEENSRILKQSQKRELRILQAEDLAALFRVLTDELAESYQLQTISVVLADPDHDIRHLLIAAGSRPSKFPQLQLVEALSGITPQYIGMPRPWLGPYSASDHQLLFKTGVSPRSIAMIPLTMRGSLIGSINFGSKNANRFTRRHATDFFAQLGAIASFALENAINKARLLRSGFTDVLTGWNNRRYLQIRLHQELARARRDKIPLTCLMIDIDHFKKVNDTYGHATGDDVLREVAHRIESEVRASDVSARYGGEEFVVLLPGNGASAGAILAERIRIAVGSEPCVGQKGQSISITASIGIASASPYQDNNDLKSAGDSLLARSDVALYRAKAAGRNQVCVEGDEHAGNLKSA